VQRGGGRMHTTAASVRGVGGSERGCNCRGLEQQNATLQGLWLLSRITLTRRCQRSFTLLSPSTLGHTVCSTLCVTATVSSGFACL
jgi:hypothetical protein